LSYILQPKGKGRRHNKTFVELVAIKSHNGKLLGKIKGEKSYNYRLDDQEFNKIFKRGRKL
jgi:hypothetical protein